jgi:hypothetical protein
MSDTVQTPLPPYLPSSSDWHKAMAELGGTTTQRNREVKGDVEVRTPEWVALRAAEHIANRIEFTFCIEDNFDVTFTHEATGMTMVVEHLWWSAKTNTDEGVRKKINRRMDWLMERVAKALQPQHQRDDELERARNRRGTTRAEVIKKALPPAKQRKPGRPKKTKAPPATPVGAESEAA